MAGSDELSTIFDAAATPVFKELFGSSVTVTKRPRAPGDAVGTPTAVTFVSWQPWADLSPGTALPYQRRYVVFRDSDLTAVVPTGDGLERGDAILWDGETWRVQDVFESNAGLTKYGVARAQEAA